MVALWPVEHASHGRDLSSKVYFVGTNPVWSGRPSLKKSQIAVSTTERYFALSVVSLIVECARRQLKGN